MFNNRLPKPASTAKPAVNATTARLRPLNRPLHTCLLTLCLGATGGLLLSPAAAEASWNEMLKDIQQEAPKLLDNLGQGKLGQNNTPLPAGLDTQTLVQGLLQALEVGTQRTVSALSQQGGYLNNPEVRINLPTLLQPAAKVLNEYGFGSLVEQLEVSMNRAAEQAVPLAEKHLLNAIRNLSIEDAKRIYQGGEDAATRYFEQQTRAALQSDLAPIIDQAMADQRVTSYYQSLLQQAKQYPLVSSFGNQLNLQNHVTDAALDGLFNRLAQEEQLIRKDPAARSTELLRKVFGSSG